MTTQIHHCLDVGVAYRPANSELERRVRGEYHEMPGLRLTVAQARRLWALDRPTCESVLDVLIEAGFLERDATGQYCRSHSGY